MFSMVRAFPFGSRVLHLGLVPFLFLVAILAIRPSAALAEELVRIGGQEAAESLLMRVLEHRATVRPVEGALTFRQLITTERLDDDGEVEASVNQLYAYEPVAGRHLWKLVEHDGEPIAGRRLRREERRYRRAVVAAHKEAGEDRRAAEENDPDHEVAPKNGMDLFYKIIGDALEERMFRGELYRGARFGGHEIQVVRFRPDPAYGKAPNRMMGVVSACEGELWVDPRNLQVARLEATLTRHVNFIAGLFGRLYEGTRATVLSEFTGAIWLPVRVTMTMNARMYFFRRIHQRVHYDFLDFAPAR